MESTSLIIAAVIIILIIIIILFIIYFIYDNSMDWLAKQSQSVVDEIKSQVPDLSTSTPQNNDVLVRSEPRYRIYARPYIYNLGYGLGYGRKYHNYYYPLRWGRWNYGYRRYRGRRGGSRGSSLPTTSIISAPVVQAGLTSSEGGARGSGGRGNFAPPS